MSLENINDSNGRVHFICVKCHTYTRAWHNHQRAKLKLCVTCYEEEQAR